jgi:hypothetical protein
VNAHGATAGHRIPSQGCYPSQIGMLIEALRDERQHLRTAAAWGFTRTESYRWAKSPLASAGRGVSFR